MGAGRQERKVHLHIFLRERKQHTISDGIYSHINLNGIIIVYLYHITPVIKETVVSVTNVLDFKMKFYCVAQAGLEPTVFLFQPHKTEIALLHIVPDRHFLESSFPLLIS